jgi:glycosyltransferase involved in cell wall biosynthesis
LEKIKPDLIVLQNDPWNIPYFTHDDGPLRDCNIPLVGFIAVDGKNVNGKQLNRLSKSIFWTEFARQEAEIGGMTVPSAVVPLGVDLDVFTPGDRVAARRFMGLPEHLWESYIVGNINRNQPRKRFDLCIRYFGRWLQESGVKDAYLFLHAAPTGDDGYDPEALARYYGFNRDRESTRLIFSRPDMFHGIPEAHLPQVYRSFDLAFTATQGEGWGLTSMEAMACGVPVLAPNWSALGEWAKPAARLVPCSSTAATVGANIIGGVMDENFAIEALDEFYHSPSVSKCYIEDGLRLVAEDRFRWENIGKAFQAEIQEYG